MQLQQLPQSELLEVEGGATPAYALPWTKKDSITVGLGFGGMAGMPFGPIGTLVGGLVGALFGAIFG